MDLARLIGTGLSLKKGSCHAKGIMPEDRSASGGDPLENTIEFRYNYRKQNFYPDVSG